MRTVLLSREHGLFRNALGLLAAIIIVPVAIVAKLFIMPFERPARSSPEELANYLRNFLNGAEDELDWEWDHFSSVPLADPQLESLRRRAAEVALPLDATGRKTLEGLLTEAEGLIAGD